MKPFRLLGIYRHPKFSNNAIEADRLILEESVKAFVKHYPGETKVDFIEEPEIAKNTNSYQLVLTMAQSSEALVQLDEQRDLLPIVWNSTQAIRNCYRISMSKRLEEANVDYAPFIIVRSWSDLKPWIHPKHSYWLKRGDFHAISDDDVTLAEAPEEAQRKLESFAKKGVREVIVQQHIHGDVYKFYGVNSSFFTAIKVRTFLNAEIKPNLDMVRENCKRAAEKLGLQIYGGDFVLDQTGKAHLIDLNDWPSFRICRETAADSIGKYAASFVSQALANPATLHKG